MQVHVIDDDPAVRQMLGTAMESASLPARLYDSAGAFLEEFDAQTAGCIVLGSERCCRRSTAWSSSASTRARGTSDHVIGSTFRCPDAVQCMKLGAVDVLQKPFKITKLIELVRGACRRVRNAASESLSRKKSGSISTLTPREEELLKLVVSGSSSKQIARSLQISVMTVANHRAHLLAKTGRTTRPIWCVWRRWRGSFRSNRAGPIRGDMEGTRRWVPLAR